jgi:hypothetical protein
MVLALPSAVDLLPLMRLAGSAGRIPGYGFEDAAEIMRVTTSTKAQYVTLYGANNCTGLNEIKFYGY